ncbi:ABC transporter substrate-binding protein [Nocardia farcinica]|uniref:ABC transporter substrate-binding protein n=1 Tax=Nocardia farcinica TaxID=37329 RepID=UPI0037A7BFFD
MSRQSFRTRVRLRLLGALAATIAVCIPLVSACGVDSATGSSATRDGTFTFVVQGPPNSFDPAHLIEGQPAYIWTALFDTLLYLDNEGNLQPNAAESWEVGPDRRTLTLKLRPGMTFSSGAPVDATAVRTTMERTKATPGPVQTWLSTVDAIRTPDDRTVVLELSRPDAALPYALAMSAGVIGDPATLDDERTALNPVGSGPYTLDTTQTVTGSVYVLNRRDDHWNAAAYPFRTVKMRVIADRTAAVNALQAGEADAGSVEVTHLPRMEAAGFDITRVEATTLVSLSIADRKGESVPALGDRRVRQAINMAFDRRMITEQLTHGMGRPTVQTFNIAGPGYDPALEGTYAFDVDGAKRLLAEAGYPNGFTVSMPEVNYLTLFAPTITQSLAAIGITVNWEPVPPQQLVAATAAKRFPLIATVNSTGPFARELQRFRIDHQNNPFRTSDPRLDDLIDRYHREADPARADELARQINRYTVEAAWDAPLLYTATQWATKGDVRYLGTGPQGLPSLRQFGVADRGAP